jgi:diguanylate cyclase (GGDEF)-like protein/PAS domain S-box-containing protein
MGTFRQILDAHPNPCVVHINFVPKYANDAFAVFSGLETAEDVLNLETIKVLFEKSHWAEADQRYHNVIKLGLPSPRQTINHTDMNGNPMIAEITDNVIDWEGQKALCTFISVVTDRIQREKQLINLAARDELTGLFNRRYFIETYNTLIKSGSIHEYLMAIVDIDLFKNVNDSYGHLAGDKMLIHIANTVSESMNEDEHIARLGGEEFVLLLKESSHVKLVSRLETLRDTIQNQKVSVLSTHNVPSEISCTVSIGLTKIMEKTTFKSSYFKADRALYQAKRNGRNQVIFDL